jgi:tetratricopeptide (TPR) repeat protein
VTRARQFQFVVMTALAASLLSSCSRDDRPQRAAVPTAHEQEVVRRKVEIAVQARHQAEQEERLQTLQTIAVRQRDSLHGRARDFTTRWQTFFARRADKKRLREEEAREEWARLSGSDREAVRAIREKLKAGLRLVPGEEDFALDKKSLEEPFGKYLLDQVRAYPARRSYLCQLPRCKELLDEAEEKERFGRLEEKARADVAAFAEQVRQITGSAEQVRAGRYEEAAVNLTAALAKSPFVPEFYALRGAVFCLALQELDRAVADLDEAARLNPADGWVWYCRGVARWLKGSPALARADFQTAVRTDPGLARLVRDLDPAAH